MSIPLKSNTVHICLDSLDAMLQESEMQVMEQGLLRWVGVISCYAHLVKRVEDEIKEFRAVSGFSGCYGST